MRQFYKYLFGTFLLFSCLSGFAQQQNVLKKNQAQSQKAKKTTSTLPPAKAKDPLKDFTQNKESHESAASSTFRFSSESEETASTLFVNQKDVFGLSMQDEMQLVEKQTDKLGIKHYKFQQHHKGYPVEGAILRLREKNGKLHTANGALAEDLKVSTTIQLSEKEGLIKALAAVGAEKYMWEVEGADQIAQLLGHANRQSFKPKGELVILTAAIAPELSSPRLAYRFDVFAAQPQLRYDVYVDAGNGAILHKLNKLYHQNQPGKAKTRYSGEVDVTTEHFEGGFRLREYDRGEGVSLFTLNGNNTQPINLNSVTDFVDADNFWNNANPQMDEVATDLHWAAEMTHDYYLDRHQRNSIDGNGMNILSFAHLGTNFFNAQWTGSWMQFGDGNGKPLTGLGIVAHEFTHGVTQHSAGLIYQGESGALNESFSDILGISVEFMAGKEPAEKIWELADELYDRSSMRSLANPNLRGDPDTYLGNYWKSTEHGSADNGGVHTNSGVQNHWYYLLVEGGSGTNDLGDAFSVQGLGIETAEKIAYRNLTYYLTPSSQYYDAREGSLMAAEDLFGFGSQEYKQVMNAWYAVGVGAAYSDTELSLTALLLPEQQCSLLSANENIQVQIRNLGAQATPAGTSFSFSVQLVNQQEGINLLYENLKASLPVDLATGEFAEFDLGNGFDFSGSGLYEVLAVMTTDGADEDPENNQNSGTLFINSPNPDNDLILSLEGIANTCELKSATETFAVNLFNAGCQEIPAGSSLSFTITLDGTAVTEELTTTEAIPSQGSMVYTFTETFDLSQSGIYALEASVEFTADPYTANNTAIGSVTSGAVAIYPYTEDFTSFNGGWSSKALSGSNAWEWVSGSWTTNANGPYPDNSDMVLNSPCFDFTGLNLPQVSFELEFSIEEGWDGMIL